ncbi:uncharacterized protein LOC143714015 [Siphateles boraxobius]|uniref:uncharacterized protein LOC143714015 n=1 Tax=Siphateles boraxobius TaxID=180520 RepID=UPI00406363BC
MKKASSPHLKCTIMETEQLVSLLQREYLCVLDPRTSPPHFLYQTVFSAGRCYSLCVRCVFSSPHSVCTASVRGKLQMQQRDQKDHLKSGNTIEGEEEVVCYASLDVITRRQKQRKTKLVQCSDFSTYAQVRTETE